MKLVTILLIIILSMGYVYSLCSSIEKRKEEEARDKQRKMYIAYFRIYDIIVSCKTIEHCASCDILINRFVDMYSEGDFLWCDLRQKICFKKFSILNNKV